MRAQVRRQEFEDGTALWRLCESDGELVDRWLPLEPFMGALDRGGYIEFADAHAFALGVNLIRAEAGLLGDLAVEQIAREREAQDDDMRERPRASRREFKAA